jgi:putative ABC transport system permease protein
MLFYRALLHLYPFSFRAEYGEEMCRIFAARLRETGSPLAGAALRIGAVLDVLPSAVRAHGDVLRQDLRYTARTLRRSPGFAATGILVAALGIGAATAAFSITDHVLIRPLPFRESNRLVALWEAQPLRGITENELSPGNLRDWKRLATSFEAMGAYRDSSINLVGAGHPERLDDAVATPELFTALRARPALGRLFTEADDRPGAPGTVILSDRLWRERFGADPGVLGRKVVLDDAPYEVVGVMPAGFLFPRPDTELWTTFRFDDQSFVDRTDTFLKVVARLRRGVSLDQARSEMQLIAARLEREFPQANASTGATVHLLRDEIPGQARLLLKALLGASAGMLLIACANLANLLLARALSRRKELSVRSAMGAGRERLVRQLLTENLVLAAGGGGLGVLLAVSAGPLVARLIPSTLPIADTPPANLRVLLFATLATAVTGIAFGVLPALRACSDADTVSLAEDGRRGATRRTERLRAGLVLVEVTASVTLLIATGLLIRALWRVRAIDPGFRAEGVLTLRTWLPMPKYAETAERERFYARVLPEVRRLPGVSSAAYISFLPMVMRGGIWPVAVGGQPEDRPENETASLRFVTSGFFETLGIPLERGRDVGPSDGLASPLVAVVSQSFTRRYWPGENPLGKRFRIASKDRAVVGVVGDVRVRGLERTSEPQVYLPSSQAADEVSPSYAPKELVIRSSVAPAALVPAVRAIVESADSELPVSTVRPLSQIVEAETAPRSVQAWALGSFAMMALLLAGVGIHGLLAFVVSQRTREIGVRMALGAPAGEILGMVLRRSLALSAAGVAIGLALAYAAGRAMQALLAGVSASDAPTFAAAAILALLMTAAGTLLPARRAVRVNPVDAIRAE